MWYVVDYLYTRAATYLEDMGYYTVDNVPADIILKFAEFCAQSDGRYDRVALVSEQGVRQLETMPLTDVANAILDRVARELVR